MKRRDVRSCVAAAVLAAACSMLSSGLAAQQSGAPASAPKAPVPTPRTADGKPDLTGRWGGGRGDGAISGLDATGNRVTYKSMEEAKAAGSTKIFARNYTARHDNATYSERDSGMQQRVVMNPPIYKPEYWAKVEHADMFGNFEDSNFLCLPAGVPRMGAPIKIVQLPKEVILFYRERNSYRIVPTDGRPRDPVASQDQTYMGDPVGRWDGDTLVVETVGFNEETWLAWPGYIHSNEMKVTERFRRDGNTLYYQVTVEDPMLAQPWEIPSRAIQLNPSDAPYPEDPACLQDGHPMVTRERG